MEWSGKTWVGERTEQGKEQAVSCTARVCPPAWEGPSTANKPEAPCKFGACCGSLPSLVFVHLASSNRRYKKLQSSLLETKAGIATVSGAQPITRSQKQALPLWVLLRSAGQAYTHVTPAAQMALFTSLSPESSASSCALPSTLV